MLSKRLKHTDKPTHKQALVTTNTLIDKQMNLDILAHSDKAYNSQIDQHTTSLVEHSSKGHKIYLFHKKNIEHLKTDREHYCYIHTSGKRTNRRADNYIYPPACL